MSTPLRVRPVQVRLDVAHLFTASLTHDLDFSKATGSTLGRLADTDGTGKGRYYKNTWRRIQSWYDTAYFKGMRLSELANAEFAGIVATALRIDTKLTFSNGSSCIIKPEKMRHAALKWYEAGWDRYELNKDDKFKRYKLYALAGSTCLGFGLPLP